MTGTHTAASLAKQDGRSSVTRSAAAEQLDTLQCTEKILIASACWAPAAWQRLRELGATQNTWMAANARHVWAAVERHYASSSEAAGGPAIRQWLGERARALDEYTDESGVLALHDSPQVEALWLAYSAARKLQLASEFELRASAKLREGNVDDAYELMNEARELRAAASDGVTWPDPMPLSAASELPAFPVEVLPAWLASWVTAESRSSQTPVDLAAMLALAVVATCVQRRVEIHARSDWREQLCLFVCVVLETGARKSPVFAKAFAPIYEYEKRKREELSTEIANTKDAEDVARRRLENAKANVAKPKRKKSLDAEVADEADIETLRSELTRAEKARVRAPELICGDVTQEALAMLLSQQGERMTLADAEGCGPIAIMLGRYSDSVNVDLFLRAYSGDRHSVHRANKDREPIVLHRPALSIALTVQPDGLSQLGEHERLLRGLGFIARFAFSVPQSTVGYRTCDPDEVPADVRNAYAANIQKLLEVEATEQGEPHGLELDSNAKALLLEFRKTLEVKLRPDGEHASRRDWCAKYPGLVLRIAGLLHCAATVSNPWETHVCKSTLENAITLGEYLLAHASAALEQIQTTPDISHAEQVLGWVCHTGRKRFSQRDAHQALKGSSWCKRSAALDEPLKVLIERDWIRESPPPERSGPGRPPSREFEVSPYAQNALNPQNGRAKHGAGHCEDSGDFEDGIGGRDDR